MKTSYSILSLTLAASLGLVGCGDDPKPPKSGSSGDAGEPASGGSTSTAGSGGSTPEPGAAGMPSEPDSGGSGNTAGTGGSEPMSGGGTSPMPGAGGEGGAPQPEPQAYYACQGTDQQFVRRAIQGVLGRRPYGQAEVNLYTDLIAEVDAMDGVDPAELAAEPGKPLRHSRKVMLSALFQSPEYQSNWEELYRDFLRVQRVDEYQNAACYGVKLRVEDQLAVAKFVRDNPPDAGGDGGVSPTMADVIAGSLLLDDITPIYTANLFGMVAKTYAGANGLAVETELGRRRDFGAWFDAVYLNRDPVCLQCHNSEFSVTQTPNPATNRHYPIPALLEKSVLGYSTGAPPVDAFDAGDIMHGGLKYARFLSDCSVQNQTKVDEAIAAGTIQPDQCPDGYRLCVARSAIGPRDWICESTYQATRNTRPWNLATACGTFTNPNAIPVDLAGVNTKFATVTGKRSSMWDMHRALRAGFNKLKLEGLGADPVTHEVPDSEKAFAYMTVMTLVEKVWKEITGTPLTIQTYFPRNEAARDQLQHLTDVFIASGYSHKALLEDIYSSPYINLAPPDSECWEGAYELPRIFDPWVTAEEDPVKRNNSLGDGAVMLSARTVARSAYGALGWRLNALGSSFPGVSVTGWVENPSGTSGTLERQFQNETGFFNKNTEVGFRGFDFQARLGFEDRFGRCAKLAPLTLYKDVIDLVLAKTKKVGTGTVQDVMELLKDRFFGTSVLEESERDAIAAILNVSLTADASALTDAGVRRVCGVMATAPQGLISPITVVPPDSWLVPKLTPVADSYEYKCDALAALTLPDGLSVTCNGDAPLSVSFTPPAAP
jgi:hypothetical protein